MAESCSWIGKAVSIQCNEILGIFQGTIKDANDTQITIVRAFRNGVPLRKQDAEVTLSLADIIKLEIIPTYSAQSTVTPTVINKPTPVKQPNFGAVPKESALTHKMSSMKLTNGQRRSPINDKMPKFISKSPSCNSFKYTGNMIPSKVEAKMGASLSNDVNHSSSKPIDIMASRSAPINTPLKQEKKKSRKEMNQMKNNTTFGTPVDDPIMGEDFDFEKNLNLFNKQALWDEIEARKKPDLVRHAVSMQKKKFRHDENVLASTPVQPRQIESVQSSHDFVTDDGLIIPTIPFIVRDKIQQLAENNGLTWSRQCDILARGTTDLAILLLGGARRLTPNNRHQWPTIVIISDKPPNSRVCEIGAATGRHLACHGLKVLLLIPGVDKGDKENQELILFKATGSEVIYNAADLPPSSDLVLLSVESNSSLSTSVRKWIIDSRSSVVAIDPPSAGVVNVPIKCSILPILPLNNISHLCGKLYLCNIGIPESYFRDAGIKYKSPFGHKFVIPIHTKD